MSADPPRDTPVAVLAFERRGQFFCCPTAAVLEILEEPELSDPGYASPMVAAVLLHAGRFVTTVDPASIFGHPGERRGDALLLQGGKGIVAVLVDKVIGFRTPSALSPAPWIPQGRICRSAAMIEGIGRAFVLAEEGLGDIPAVAPPVAPRRDDDEAGTVASDVGATTHLVFTIAGRTFAASYGDVVRILYRQRLFRVPGAVPPIHHAVEVIGAIVPVLDLAEPTATPEVADFVVLSSSAGSLALRVDTIERPLPLVRDVTEPGWFPAFGIDGIARAAILESAAGSPRVYSVITGEALLRDLCHAATPGGFP
ncbi:hypothetical protein N825_19265 [Skermanella stibiiresistens SB22]|uniref:CheW-like domain-containing protein n=1 Tax=Skermanella stibiiresistens SB22 TaxID=1385369 RepID=W9H7W6_9PROT|nr:chemotaxis protein CheW [Skermanella stibiiresistens]EWY42340.1 hypothetical protein N825_19265 [Skermanella stibiiresistens SB22]